MGGGCFVARWGGTFSRAPPFFFLNGSSPRVSSQRRSRFSVFFFIILDSRSRSVADIEVKTEKEQRKRDALWGKATASSRKTIRGAKSAQERGGKKKRRLAPFGMTVGERCEVKGEKSKAAGPSDDGLKFGQFTCIVEARSNLLAGEIGKLSQNVRGSFARGQVTQHQADGNTGSLDARFSTEDFRVAHDVLFPWHRHAPILSPFPGNGKRRAVGEALNRGAARFRVSFYIGHQGLED